MIRDLLVSQFEKVTDGPDAISRLRRFVIDLAVHGKLANQESDDPAADLLIQQIASIPRDTPLSPRYLSIVEAAIVTPLFELPRQWRWTRLGLIAEYIQRGKSPKYSDSTGPLVVSQKCVRWDGLDLIPARSITPESLEAYEPVRFLQDGDLLWNSTGTGTIGRLSRVVSPPDRLVCDSHVTIVRCSHVDPEFIRCWLRSDHVFGKIEGSASGSTNQVELTLQMALSQPVPLPPLLEQHRIVAQVNEMMALCNQLETAQKVRESHRDALRSVSLHRLTSTDDDANRTSNVRFFLKTSPRLITKPMHVAAIRQTMLDLAVQGRLVPQDPDDEPAAELMKRIRVGKSGLVATGHIKYQNAQPAVAQSDLDYALPNGWEATRIGDLLTVIRGASPRPKGDPKYFSKSRTPYHWIKISDIRKHSTDRILQDTDEFLTEAGMKKSVLLPRGTLVVTNSATIGVPIFLGLDGGCIHDGYLAFPYFPDTDLSADYFFVLFQTLQAYAVKRARGMAQLNLNTGLVRQFPLGLPPLAEQHRIVARVDELMAVCDELEATLVTTRNEQGRLLEALLHDALNETARTVAATEGVFNVV